MNPSAGKAMDWISGRRWRVDVGLPPLWQGVVLAVLYFATARLGLLLALPPEKKATAVWPPSGIALAALVLFGHRIWPGVWVGAFLANLWDWLSPNNLFPVTTHALVSSGIASGSTLQALAGTSLIRRWIGEGSPFERPSHAFTFAGVAMLACLIAATIGVASLHVGGYAPTHALGTVWWTWWLGDMTGILTVGSLILTWSLPPLFDWQTRRLPEAILFFAVLVTLTSAIFAILPHSVTPPAPLAYLTIPLLVWATFRFGLHGAATALFLVSAIAVLGTSQGAGPFAQPTVHESLLLLQVFMGVIAVTALVMAAVLNQRHRIETMLGASEERYRLLTEALPHMVWSMQPDLSLDFLNGRSMQFTGQTLEQLHGGGWGQLVHPEDHSVMEAMLSGPLKRGDPHEVEFRFRHHTGEYRWVVSHAIPVKDKAGELVKWIGCTNDIHDRRVAEAQLLDLTASLERKVEERTRELRESEQRFRAIFHTQFQFIGLMSPSGVLLEANHAALGAAGVSEETVLGKPFWETPLWSHDPSQQERLREAIHQAASGERVRFEASQPSADGTVKWVDFSLTPFLDDDRNVVFLIPEGRDITKRRRTEDTLRRQEEQLRASLREKEVLLKEIHHRVKNNLQIVSSLLDLQADHAQDWRTLEMFKESRGRVKSMALIHERLYRSQDLAKVNFADYIRPLAEDLYHTYRISNGDIVFHVEVDVPPLPIDIAIPCGLIINELISNCFKHAFASTSEGWVRVTLRGDGSNTVLSVADNGAGFPPTLDYRNTTSFGLQLVNTLTEQLQGELELNRNQGSEFVITFPLLKGSNNGSRQ